MKLLATLLLNLPAILRLLENMQKRIDEAEAERKVANDLEEINKAFEAKDPEKLKKIFSS